MRVRRLIAMGAILTFCVLAGGYYFTCERRFNARMNEDVERFQSRFQDARSESERAQSLRQVLLEVKQNTTSFVSGTFNAMLFSLLFLSVVLWAMTADSRGSEHARLQSPGQRDGESSPRLETPRSS